MLRELVLRNRSYRRFYQETPICRQQLLELIDLARLSASAANRQPLKYFLSYTPDLNAKIFQCLAWAGYLPEWPGPSEGERPSAYIVILHDSTISGEPGCDHGIAAQSILLGAVEQGLGGCIIGAVDRKKLATILHIPEQLQILLVLALGKPKETVVLDSMDTSGSIRYWRESNGIHHVPKRALTDLVVEFQSKKHGEQS